MNDSPTRAGLSIPAGLWAELRRAYGDPRRAYHGLRHIDEVLARYDEVASAVAGAARAFGVTMDPAEYG